MKLYEPMAGENISLTVENMRKLANKNGGIVGAIFNDTPFYAFPLEGQDEILLRWHTIRRVQQKWKGIID